MTNYMKLKLLFKNEIVIEIIVKLEWKWKLRVYYVIDNVILLYYYNVKINYTVLHDASVTAQLLLCNQYQCSFVHKL